jgi:hypothetical protein
VRLSGRPELTRADTDKNSTRLVPGETKIHLHDSSLPDFSKLVDDIAGSHDGNRNVAIYCVTEVELFFSLSACRFVEFPREYDSGGW